MLQSYPVPNAAAATEAEPDQVRITLPRRRPRYLIPPISWLIRPGPTKTLVLDRLGGEVWQDCDGERTVEELVDVFAARHQLTFHEARVAVSGYLKRLIANEALLIAVPETVEIAAGAGNRPNLA
jgi:hypothetical protein